MCKQVKTWIDENGKQWETVQETCDRCGGIGEHHGHGWDSYINGKCFKCEGKKYVLIDRRILTTKEQEQRQRARQRRVEKVQQQQQEQQAKLEIERQNKINEYIQQNPATYICIDKNEAYANKETLKTNGYKFYTWNWAGHKAINGIKTIAVNTIDVMDNIELKLDADKINDKVKEYREQQKQQDKINSQFIGNIGDKIEVIVSLVNSIEIYSQYGTSYINLFRDRQGNIYKWSSKNCTEADENELATIKATIKAHEEYNEQKQTVITRCKIV